MLRTHFNDTFLTKCFGRYYGRLQGEVITKIQRYNVIIKWTDKLQSLLLIVHSDMFRPLEAIFRLNMKECTDMSMP